MNFFAIKDFSSKSLTGVLYKKQFKHFQIMIFYFENYLVMEIGYK